eukprot:442060-Prymnesium_polylepis.1
MLNRGLSRGWLGWQEMLAERASAIEAMRRGLLFMQNSSIVFAMRRWRKCIAGDAALARGLKHMLNRCLSRGWLGWQEMLAERAAAMEAMRRGLLFMVNRQAAAAFVTWSCQLRALQREGAVGCKLAKAL